MALKEMCLCWWEEKLNDQRTFVIFCHSVEDIFTNGLPLSVPIFDVAIHLEGNFNKMSALQVVTLGTRMCLRRDSTKVTATWLWQLWQEGNRKGSVWPGFSWGGRLPGARHQARGWTWRESPIFVGNPRFHSGLQESTRLYFIICHLHSGPMTPKTWHLLGWQIAFIIAKVAMVAVSYRRYMIYSESYIIWLIDIVWWTYIYIYYIYKM